jgi:formylglycine-generating enzyme required for sulfatase activity
MTRPTFFLLTFSLLAAPLQAAETRSVGPDRINAAPIHLAASTDPMVQMRHDQYWANLDDAFKAGDWGSTLGCMRKLDALGVDLPAEYAFMKAKALLETGDAAGAEEQAMRYLRQAGSGGAHYKEALGLLSQAEKAKSGDIRTFRDCATCPEMAVIPAGSFMMGGDGGEPDDKPVHRVDVPAFAMGKTEVTQAQWRAIMGGNPSVNKGCDDCPVEQVSWHDAQDYLNRLSSRTGQRYRLPSEAEWEYACRAGGRHEYCGGDSLDSLAWYRSNIGVDKTRPVAGKQANAWGLYDMSGNVWEWVLDCWNGSYNCAPTDGSAWTSGDCGKRVLRGGSWYSIPSFTRAALRCGYATANRSDDVGFRPARSLSP